MVFGIISAIIGAFGDIIYKKSLELAYGKISNKYYQFIGNFFMILFLPLIYLYFKFEGINLTLLILLFISAVLSIISELFEQYAYKNEKISVLLPYGEFQSILTIVIGFFIFSDNSLISFIFALFAGITLVIGGLDFKEFKFNKYCLSMSISALFGAIKYIIFGYLLLHLSEYSILFYNVVITFLVLLVTIIISKEFFVFKKIDTKMSKFIILENLARLSVSFITLFLISELGLVQAVLIGMLYLIVSLFFSFIFLKNIPNKKELIIVIFVFVFVTLGSMLG